MCKERSEIETKSMVEAAQAGNKIAQHNLGNFFARKGKYGIAMDWWRRSAEQDCTSAQLNLGYVYENGFGCTRNLSTAMEWYEQAASLRDQDARDSVLRLLRAVFPEDDLYEEHRTVKTAWWKVIDDYHYKYVEPMEAGVAVDADSDDESTYEDDDEDEQDHNHDQDQNQGNENNSQAFLSQADFDLHMSAFVEVLRANINRSLQSAASTVEGASAPQTPRTHTHETDQP
jgi:TPR repeat protein